MRLTLRNLASEATDPASALEALNRLVHRFPMQGFTTVAYTIVDRDRRECRVSLAGHYPPALMQARLLDALDGLTGDPDEVCDQLIARLEPDGRGDLAIVAVRTAREAPLSTAPFSIATSFAGRERGAGMPPSE